MISNDLLRGRLVRLGAIDSEKMAEAMSRWHRASTYWRLMNTEISRVHSPRAARDWIEKEIFSEKPSMYWFAIYTLAEDRLIGDIDLLAPVGGHGESFVGIGIGEPEFWGKGYGTDAMRIVLRYAFMELNLQ